MGNPTKLNDEVYPRAPLVEVVFELRFSGEPAIECHRDELFQFVRTAMPVVKVPEASSPEHFKFRTYQYTSEDHAFTVMAGLNLFLYSSKRYTGFSDFKSQLQPIFEYFIGRFKIGPLKRFGFRYINAIPYTREDSFIPLSKYFRSTFSVSPDIADHMEECNISLVQKVNEGRVITRVAAMKKRAGEQEALLLDIDYFRTAGLHASNFAQYLDEGHLGAKRYFESIITDQYREFLKEKPLV